MNGERIRKKELKQGRCKEQRAIYIYEEKANEKKNKRSKRKEEQEKMKRRQAVYV